MVFYNYIRDLGHWVFIMVFHNVLPTSHYNHNVVWIFVVCGFFDIFYLVVDVVPINYYQFTRLSIDYNH